ncbi:hypothetical protein B0T39_02485 [Chromobacterium haemolyticum]|nr:hypothetical protein B0T39_02485 [Chromobacterium haemolyticum]
MTWIFWSFLSPVLFLKTSRTYISHMDILIRVMLRLFFIARSQGGFRLFWNFRGMEYLDSCVSVFLILKEGEIVLGRF